jgi:hypothetical protein
MPQSRPTSLPGNCSAGSSTRPNLAALWRPQALNQYNLTCRDDSQGVMTNQTPRIGARLSAGNTGKKTANHTARHIYVYTCTFLTKVKLIIRFYLVSHLLLTKIKLITRAHHGAIKGATEIPISEYLRDGTFARSVRSETIRTAVTLLDLTTLLNRAG